MEFCKQIYIVEEIHATVELTAINEIKKIFCLPLQQSIADW
jgi:hypothetical protein